MKAAWKLALSYALRRPMRMLLTSTAVVASSCIVVWVVSGYDALRSQFGEQATEYLGRYDFFIVPEDAGDARIDTDLVAALREDPDVAEVEAVMQVRAQRLMNPNAGPGGPGMGGRGGPDAARPGRGDAVAASKTESRGSTPPARGSRGSGSRRRFGRPSAPTLVGTDAKTPPQKMLEGEWIDPGRADERGVVIGNSLAEQTKLKLGDSALVIVGPKEFRVKIAGIIEDGPSRMAFGRMPRPSADKAPTGIAAGPASSAVYLPIALAKHFSRGKAETTSSISA